MTDYLRDRGEDDGEVAVLLVSELVTNAILHGHGTARAARPHRGVGAAGRGQRPGAGEPAGPALGRGPRPRSAVAACSSSTPWPTAGAGRRRTAARSSGSSSTRELSRAGSGLVGGHSFIALLATGTHLRPTSHRHALRLPTPLHGSRDCATARPSGQSRTKSHHPHTGPGRAGYSYVHHVRVHPALVRSRRHRIGLVGRLRLVRDRLRPRDVPRQRLLGVVPADDRARSARGAAPPACIGRRRVRRAPRTYSASASEPRRRRCPARTARSCSRRSPARCCPARRPRRPLVDAVDPSLDGQPVGHERRPCAPPRAGRPAEPGVVTYRWTCSTAHARAVRLLRLVAVAVAAPRCGPPARARRRLGGPAPAARTSRAARCAPSCRASCAPTAAPWAGWAGRRTTIR